jgi:hypothetical protein
LLLFSIFLIAKILTGCAGADTPFTLVQPTNPDQSGNPPGGGTTGSGGTDGGGCVITFTSKITLDTKLAPGASTSADPTGLIAGDPHDIPPIKMHFNGSTVTMNGDEFQEGSLTLGTQTIKVRQKAGTTATGTYSSSDGSITISGIQFEITSPLSIELPPFDLTTGSTGTIHGDFGDLTAQGAPLTPDKKMKLAGGFKIATFPLAEFIGAAVTLTLDGTVDQIPGASCAGGGSGGGGLSFKEVVTNPDHTTTEVDLATNNTLNLGSVFVPQAGTDNPGPTDPNFFVTKTLRVENQTSAAVSATISNPDGYQITPNGSVSIAAGANQDFQVKFGFAPVTDYSQTNVPPTKNVTGTLTFGSSTVNLAGTAKRAGAELTATGTETSAPTTIDFGVTPVQITGSGSTSKLKCVPGSPIPNISRKVVLQNTGIRPLHITKINAPTDSGTDTAPDPGCVSYSSSFVRMGLAVEGGASCQTVTVMGHTYLTDNCTIPVGAGKVSFKTVYIPKNAASIRDNGQDTGSMTIQNDDPLYATAPLTITLQGAVSKDTSDLLSVQKKGSNFNVRNNGSISMNIPNTTDTQLDVVLEFLNASSDQLQNIQLSLEGTDAAKFQICPATATTAPPLTGCAASNPTAIANIPAMVGTEEGKAYLGIRFTKPASGTGPFDGKLKMQYSPASSPTANNQFEVTLLGTVGFNPLHDSVQINMEYIGSFITGAGVQLDPTDSIDFRDPANANFKSGPLKLHLTPSSGDPTISDVTIDAPDPASINLASMTKDQRRQLIRIFTSRNSTCSSSGTPCPTNGVPSCTDPDDISGTYENGKCSYFYYAIGTGDTVGKYNSETGEMTLPDLKIRLMNPYHAGLIYPADQRTDTRLDASLSTLLMNTKTVRLDDFGGNTVDLVPADGISSLAIPASIFDPLAAPFPCPTGWDPTKDFNPANHSDSPAPTFSCYLTRSSATSDPFIGGRASIWVRPNEQSVILSMITKFGPGGAPEDIPFFMANGTMWVAMQGRMVQQ